MQRIGFLILAEEMLRRSDARGVEVRFWDEEYRETTARIERKIGYIDIIKGAINDRLGKKDKV